MRRFLRLSARLLTACAVLLLLGAGLATRASAHAEPVSSSPADGASLSEQPATVSVVLGEETSLTDSTFEVYYQRDPSSAQVRSDNGDGKVDINDRTKMKVSLKPGLGGGIYTVKWHTVTLDDNGQKSGSWIFTVSGAAGSAGGTPATTGNAQPAPTATAPSLPQTGQPIPPLTLTLALAALALLGGLGLRRMAPRGR